MERVHIVGEVILELAHIDLFALAAQKLPPRREQVFDRNDIFIRMSKLDSAHSFERIPPPTISQQNFVPVVLTLKDSYGLWQQLLPHASKTQRRTLGEKIDGLFLETLELAFRASYLSGPQKVEVVEKAVVRLDLVKFFLLISWEIGMLTDKQYAQISAPLVAASKMLVGWKAYLEKKTPPS